MLLAPDGTPKVTDFGLAKKLDEAGQTATWDWLEDELLTLRRPDPRPTAEGFYFDPDTGEPVRDRSRNYVVAVPHARVAELRRLLRQACGQFGQKCIYLSVAGLVEFVEENDAPG